MLQPTAGTVTVRGAPLADRRTVGFVFQQPTLPDWLSERAIALLLFAALIGGWELAARRLGVSALVLPPPSRLAGALWQGLASG